MPVAIPLPQEQAIEITSPRKFHQIFTIPATDEHGPLKVTYAVVGPEKGDDVPTIVFCGGMFGTRWMGILMNWLAEKEGVRMLLIDRPGFGGSDPVPIPLRIPVFLETVPRLLSHLSIKHISIVSHSAGTIYALNLLYHCPELLSPIHPSITLLSPWVHQSISSVSFLQAASLLPNPLLNYWDSVVKFALNTAGPAFGASSGAISSFSSIITSKTASDESKEEEERKCLAGYGIGMDVKKEIDKLIFNYIFAENAKGGNDEARLCMKSVEGCDWGACENYPVLIEKLKPFWEERVQENGEMGKLRVNILFAEEDLMIGKKGRRYFEECWMKEKCGSGIEVEMVEQKGGDHESTWDPSKGTVGDMFATAQKSMAAVSIAPEVGGGDLN